MGRSSWQPEAIHGALVQLSELVTVSLHLGARGSYCLRDKYSRCTTLTAPEPIQGADGIGRQSPYICIVCALVSVRLCVCACGTVHVDGLDEQGHTRVCVCVCAQVPGGGIYMKGELIYKSSTPFQLGVVIEVNKVQLEEKVSNPLRDPLSREGHITVRNPKKSCVPCSMRCWVPDSPSLEQQARLMPPPRQEELIESFCCPERDSESRGPDLSSGPHSQSIPLAKGPNSIDPDTLQAARRPQEPADPPRRPRGRIRRCQGLMALPPTSCVPLFIKPVHIHCPTGSVR